ncbi:MAG: 50S ribosomal protein L25/general stress protein Ctc [Dermabacter sp.]|nr:50S ribosomal protein L25/general stress protein Ctc [Dermabacter sp.]
MAESLKVEVRTEFGKGFARRLRMDNKVPAVLYGHGTDPVHLVLPRHETALIARNANALIELEIPGSASELAIIKDIQRHPLTRLLQHVDLLLVKRGEKVQVDIPVIIEGETVSPAVAVVDIQHVTIEADALKLPEQVVVNVEGMEDGVQIFAGDLDLGAGVELVTDAELLVVAVQVPRVDQADLDADAAEAEAAAEAAEGAGE